MRAMAAAVRYQMPVLVLLACRVVSPRSSTRWDGEGGEANDVRRVGEAMEMLGSVSCVVIRMR